MKTIGDVFELWARILLIFNRLGPLALVQAHGYIKILVLSLHQETGILDARTFLHRKDDLLGLKSQEAAMDLYRHFAPHSQELRDWMFEKEHPV